jgi:hypothetical protein
VGRRRSGGGASGWLRWLEIRQQLVDEDNGGLGEDGSGGCRGRRRRRLQGKGKGASRGCGRGELGLGCVGGGGVREWRLGGGGGQERHLFIPGLGGDCFFPTIPAQFIPEIYSISRN